MIPLLAKALAIEWLVEWQFYRTNATADTFINQPQVLEYTFPGAEKGSISQWWKDTNLSN